MPAHMTFCTTCTSKESNTSINRGEEEMLKPMTTNASFRSIASWLSDNIASVFPQQLPLPCQFLTSGKTTRSLICPTTFQAREARSLRSPVQSASSTAVEALQAQFPMFPMFPSQACWNQFLRFQASIYLLSRGCLKRPARSPVPVYACPTWTFCTTCTSKESNTSINRGEEEMLQPMTTNASFRSIASWLSDNIVSMQEKMHGFFGYVLYSSTGRNSCHLSLFFSLPSQFT